MNFRIKNITLKIGFPFAAVAAYMLSTELCVSFLLAVLFASCHEIGHIAAIAFFGGKTDGLSLSPAGLKLEKKPQPLSLKRECIVSLCGPAVNLLLASVFFPVRGVSSLTTLAFRVNSGLFAANMLPVKALDGGRALYFFLLDAAGERIACTVSSLAEILCVAALCALMIYSLVSGRCNASFAVFTLSVLVASLIK